jgi:dolichol-phosphate mannosyltransferase
MGASRAAGFRVQGGEDAQTMAVEFNGANHAPQAAAATCPAPTPPRALLSIILPAFNEQEVLPQTYARFTAVGPTLAQWGLDYELIFVNDGSRDSTAALLDQYALADPHVRAVHLTRNFGHQAAITAGLTVARGDVVAIMDCDLQDPPEVLPQFIDKWREGFQVVYAVRQKRKEWFGKRLAYWSFYRLLRAISELDIPLDSGDFCLMDRSAVNLLNSLPERQRFVRGLRTWVGLKQVGVTYERQARQAGVPQYTLAKLLKLAADGLVSFSGVPLKFVTRLGLLGVGIAFALGIWVLVASALDIKTPRGWASTACLILLMGSLQLISLGIIGEYLSRVFIEVKGRPTFLIASIVEAPAGGAERLGPAPASESAPAAVSSEPSPAR